MASVLGYWPLDATYQGRDLWTGGASTLNGTLATSDAGNGGYDLDNGITSTIFDGASSVTTDLAAGFETGTITMEALVYRANNTTRDVLFGAAGTSPYAFVAEAAVTSDWWRFWGNTASAVVSWTTAPPVGAWTHVMLVWQPVALVATLWVNGVNLGTKTPTALSGTQTNFKIGAYGNGVGSAPWDGNIAHVAVHTGDISGEGRFRYALARQAALPEGTNYPSAENLPLGDNVALVR